ARAIAGGAIAAASQPYEIEAHRLVAGMSAGVAMVAAGETDPLAVLERSGTALRRARSSGGNAVDFFDAAMASDVAAGQRLEQELWEAFRQRQFEVFYQPVVSLAAAWSRQPSLHRRSRQSG